MNETFPECVCAVIFISSLSVRMNLLFIVNEGKTKNGGIVQYYCYFNYVHDSLRYIDIVRDV